MIWIQIKLSGTPPPPTSWIPNMIKITPVKKNVHQKSIIIFLFYSFYSKVSKETVNKRALIKEILQKKTRKNYKSAPNLTKSAPNLIKFAPNLLQILPNMLQILPNLTKSYQDGKIVLLTTVNTFSMFHF